LINIPDYHLKKNYFPSLSARQNLISQTSGQLALFTKSLFQSHSAALVLGKNFIPQAAYI